MKKITINQVADHYAVDRTTVYRWIHEGMPYTTLPSGRKRFTIESIDSWMTKKEEGN